MQVIKLYLKYFCSRSNIIMMIILELFLIGSYLVSIINLNESMSYNEVLQFYLENSLYYTKFLLILFSCFSFMKLCSERNEYILNIVITAGYNKKDNYKYMLICNLIIIFIIISTSFIFFTIIGYSVKHYFYLKYEYLNAFINIFVLSIYYGLLSYFFSQLFHNQFIYIIVIILFIISELFIENETVFKYVYLYFLPNMKNINGDLYINIIYLIIVIIMLYIINRLIYLNNDLKN